MDDEQRKNPVGTSIDFEKTLAEGVSDEEIMHKFAMSEVELGQARQMLAFRDEDPDAFTREFNEWMEQDHERYQAEWEALIGSMPTPWGQPQMLAIHEFEERWRVPRWQCLTDAVETH